MTTVASASPESVYLAALSVGSRAMMQADNWADGVDRLLAEIGRATGASRVWVFQLLEIQPQAVLQDYVFEWAAAPAYRQLMQRRFRFFRSGLEDPAYRRLVEERRDGGCHDLCVPDMADGPLRRHLESQDILSMATVPIMVHGEWWGTLGIDDCRRAIAWKGPGLDLLIATAELIAAAIYRHRLTSRSRQVELFQRVANCGVWEVALRNGHVWCSEALKAQLGYPATYPRVPLRRMLARLWREDRHQLWQQVRGCLAGRQSHCRLDVRMPLDAGGIGWFEIVAEIQRDEAGRPLAMAGILIDIHRRKRDEERSRRAAETDALTGALNRRGLMRWLKDHARRESVHLMLLDIDHFKAVNDRYGHAAGDALLCRLSRRLHGELRENDALVRLGGEEFALLIRSDDGARMLALAERLRGVVADRPFHLTVPGALESVTVAVSISLGVARMPPGTMDLETRQALALVWADEALYAAKQAGRNRTRRHASVTGPGNGAVGSAER
ncbi:diguanylate cyclase [Halomonas sp. THAF12]|uniref:sensor domain-containing diguanylate cyclase n=1 Tax=Halomonas sp. B23F22_10 TaxID=3459515 RepID=UPI00373F7C76